MLGLLDILISWWKSQFYTMDSHPWLLILKELMKKDVEGVRGLVKVK